MATLTNAYLVPLLYLENQNLVGYSQGRILRDLQAPRSEEREHFRDLCAKWARAALDAPRTYDQDGLGDKAMVHFHLFRGGMDWWITELDRTTADDKRAGIPSNSQAFGYADLGMGGAELGYISLPELAANGVELDLYWSPKTLGEVKQGRT